MKHEGNHFQILVKHLFFCNDHIDNSRAIDAKPSNIRQQKIELRAQDEIAEKKSNPGKLNSEEVRKICINFMEDEKEQTSLIMDSKTSLGFRENVTSEVGSMPLLSYVSTSNISDNSFPAQGDTLRKGLVITIMKCFVYSRAYPRIFEL